jgi:hypothetical protein
MLTGRRFPEAFAFVVLLANAVLILASYHSLPAIVPMHFGATGEPGNYGPKWTVWMTFAFGAFMYIFLSAIARVPIQYANLPVKLTDGNRGRMTLLVREMTSWIKAWTQVISYALSVMVILAASTPGPQFALTIVEYAATLAILATCGIYIIRIRRAA